jgi:uncharacterized protein (TIGR03067 family)
LVIALVSCGGCANPKKAVEQLERGKAAVEKKDWPTAIHELDDAIKNDPKLAEAYLLRATAINECVLASAARGTMRGDYTRRDALKDIDGVLALKPECGEAYLQQGYALGGLAQTRDAMEAFSKAIPLLPDPTKAYLERAALHFHHSEYAAAAADMDQVVSREPLEAEYYATRATYRRFARQFRGARQDQAKAERLRTDSKNVSLEDLKKLEADGLDYDKIAKSQDTPAVRAEAKRLFGKWQVLSNDTGGHVLETASRDYSFTFRPGECTLVLDGKTQQKGTFRLDVEATPRPIDLDGKADGQPATFLAIYELRDDSTLRLILSHPGEARPTDFETIGQMRTLYTLKRVQSTQDE